MKKLIIDIIKDELLKEDKMINFGNPSNNFVVIAGGPGAGKSFITKNLINLNNVKEFNVDQVRVITVKNLKSFLSQDRGQPVNVVYDAGGGQEQVMKDVHKIAKESGMVTNLVYVRTPLELAQIRNDKRPRSLPNDMVAQYHQKVRDNMRNMIPVFDNVWIVDNKELIDLSDRPSDNIEKIK